MRKSKLENQISDFRRSRNSEAVRRRRPVPVRRVGRWPLFGPCFGHCRRPASCVLRPASCVLRPASGVLRPASCVLRPASMRPTSGVRRPSSVGRWCGRRHCDDDPRNVEGRLRIHRRRTNAYTKDDCNDTCTTTTTTTAAAMPATTTVTPSVILDYRIATMALRIRMTVVVRALFAGLRHMQCISLARISIDYPSQRLCETTTYATY